MKKSFFTLFMILPLLLQVPGCTFLEYSAPSNTPLDISLQSPDVRSFMDQFPNAKTSLDYYAESEINSVLSMIRKECNNAAIDAKELYKLTLIDEATKASKTVWIDWRDKAIECIV